jgi:hypothetical protein
MTLDKQNDDTLKQSKDETPPGFNNNTKNDSQERVNKRIDGSKEEGTQNQEQEIGVHERKDKREGGIEEEEGEATQKQKPEERPPLPPRPSLLQNVHQPFAPLSTPKRPALASKPTIALSSVDIQTLSFPDGSRGTFSTPAHRLVSESLSVSGLSTGQSTPHRKASQNGSEFDDSTSLMSYAPTLRANGDLASLLDEGLNSQSPAWKLLSTQADSVNPFENVDYEDISLASFDQEFDQIAAVDAKEGNEGMRLMRELGGASNCALRGSLIAMEIQAQALFDTIFRR